MPAQQKIAACLWFDNNALEAANFYVSVFDGTIDTVNLAKLATPGCEEGDVLLVEFTLAGSRYQALNGGPHERFNDSVSLSVSCVDQAEVDHYWEALAADGGEPIMCGWLKDKFGLRWQIVPQQLPAMLSDPDQARALRVMEAMLQMVRLDVSKLLAAANGP